MSSESPIMKTSIPAVDVPIVLIHVQHGADPQSTAKELGGTAPFLPTAPSTWRQQNAVKGNTRSLSTDFTLLTLRF